MDNEKDLPKGLSIVHNKSSTVFEIRFRKNGHQFRRRLPPNTKRPEAIKILQNINSQKNTKKLDNMLITLPQKAAKDFGSNYPDIDKKNTKNAISLESKSKKERHGAHDNSLSRNEKTSRFRRTVPSHRDTTRI